METGHNNPWAALHIPLVDTSDWFIKERETAVQDLERLMREVQAAHAEEIGQMPETRDKTASIQRLCGVSRIEANRRRKIALVCAKFPMALELLQAGKISVEHLLALEPAAKHDSAVALLDEALHQRHLNEWLIDQGFTDVEVLGHLCKPHHRHIHTSDLKATRQPDGTVTIHERATGSLIAIASTRIAIAA